MPYNFKDGLGAFAYILCYDFVLIIGIALLTSYRNTSYEIIYYPLGIIFFTFMLHHFVALVRLGIGDTAVIFNPGFFILVPLPVIIIFALLIYRIKYWYILMLSVLIIPVPFIIKDQMEINHYKNTCNQNTPKAWYDPIYLPVDFFHEEIDHNGVNKLVPNIIKLPVYDDRLYDKYKKHISFYWDCDIFKGNATDVIERRARIKNLILQGNIVLCPQTMNFDDCSWIPEESIRTMLRLNFNKHNCIPEITEILPLSKTVYRLTEDGSFIPVATFFAQQYIGTPFMRKLFPNYNKIFCEYNPDDTYNNHSWYRKSEQAFENYIKLKK